METFSEASIRKNQTDPYLNWLWLKCMRYSAYNMKSICLMNKLNWSSGGWLSGLITSSAVRKTHRSSPSPFRNCWPSSPRNYCWTDSSFYFYNTLSKSPSGSTTLTASKSTPITSIPTSWTKMHKCRSKNSPTWSSTSFTAPTTPRSHSMSSLLTTFSMSFCWRSVPNSNSSSQNGIKGPMSPLKSTLKCSTTSSKG